LTQSESLAAAVPTAADSWTDIGTFTVPAGVRRLKKVQVGVAPDWGTSATSIRKAPVFRLIGSGLLEQSPHHYLGPFGGQGMVTDGSASENQSQVEYDVDIPVTTGGTFTAQCNSLDEVITAGTALIAVFYDNEAPKVPNSMSDYVDAAGSTSAGVWATIGTFMVPQAGAGKSPTKIRAVVIGVAVDQGTSAVSLRVASRFRLSGSGINEGGAHEFLGPQGFTGEVTAGQVCLENTTIIVIVDIPVNAGGTILAEHNFTTETPTASTVAMGLLYA